MKTPSHSAVPLIISVALILMFLFFIPVPLQSLQPPSTVPGQSLSFNKANSCVRFDDNNTGLDSGNKVSLSAWVKLNHKGSGKKSGIVTLAGNSIHAGQFWLLEDNSQFEFVVQNNALQKGSVKTSVPVKAGTWNHIAGVYNGEELKLYINGVLQGKVKMNGNINQYRGDFRLLLGGYSNDPEVNTYVTGSMDEVSIWKIALDQDQVRKIMCRKLNGKEYGLLDYWNMDEEAVARVHDLGPGKRNGVMKNTEVSLSGAPVGDESVYTYRGASLALAHPDNNDSLVVNNFNAVPAGIHIYRVDAFPNGVTQPETYSGLFANYYFGVFVVGPSGETYDVSWYYKGHKGIGDYELLDMAARSDNAEQKCIALNSGHDEINNRLMAEKQEMNNEYILGLRNKGFSDAVLNLDANVEKDFVEINWALQPAAEPGSYQVARSTDGINFKPIDRKKASDNRYEVRKYCIRDKKPFKGVSYYRLEKINEDNTVKLCGLLTVVYPAGSPKNDFEFTRLLPNVLNNEIIIGLNCKKNMQLGMEILDFAGNLVYSGKFDAKKGKNTIDYISTSLIAGENYQVSLSDNFQHTTSLRIPVGN